MSFPCPLRRLAAWLAIGALLLRCVLPGLHQHGDLHPHGAGAASEVVPAAVCACGATHAPVTDASERATEGPRHAAGTGCHGHCAACELEVSAPGAAPPAGETQTLLLPVGSLPSLATSLPVQRQSAGTPPSRAPPTVRV